MKRDRYSYVLPFVFIGFALLLIALWLFFVKKSIRQGFHTVFIGTLFLGYGSYKGRQVVKEGTLYHFYIAGMLVKGEEKGSIFELVEPNNPPYTGDGICIKANGVYRRYKAVDGADICLKDGKIVPCGWGSWLMQKLGGGGWEPRSIQHAKGWECPPEG